MKLYFVMFLFALIGLIAATPINPAISSKYKDVMWSEDLIHNGF